MQRCEKGFSTKSTLRDIRSRKFSLQNPTLPDSNINYKLLLKDELIKRLENAQSQRREALKKAISLSMKINRIFDKEYIKVSNDQRELLCNCYQTVILLKKTLPCDLDYFQILEDINLDNLKEHEKNLSIVFDEMKLRCNLVYRKSTGKVIGYTEVGDLNGEISEFSVRCCRPVADTLNISKIIST